MNLPVALTCGEPAGVAIELAAKAWQQLRHENPFFLIADIGHVETHRLSAPIARIGSPAECKVAARQGLPVLHLEFPCPTEPGRPNPANSGRVVDAIRLAVNFAKSGEASAICTGPLNKIVFSLAGLQDFVGHTEFIAALCGVDHLPVMMLASRRLRVVPATVHVPLRNVPSLLSHRRLKRVIRTSFDALQTDFGIGSPRIAVSGLNPHAGEGGLLGREEREVIAPVIKEMVREGMNVSGPHSADTMFHAARIAEYDAAICMYHDQALIPIKTLDFHETVNVTLGLPIVRTSPDHGTALDLAGTGRARPDSLVAAIQLAKHMAARRNFAR
ncbi:MAG: 4-hydroxythreonine-4-phosphate dehydrogenase PdxA [Rhodobacteraceae bacterium]|nr:4-hydroxythreonine-4-phosphate dehydrogenase PdxA [Paracoccaceae bacterium]